MVEHVEKYRVEKSPPSSLHSKQPRHAHSSGSSHGGYDSRPPPQSGSSYQSRGSSSYHHSQGSSLCHSRGDFGYRGSRSRGYRDSYKYRDSPPQNRDFSHYDQPRYSGKGYRPPHPRNMEPSPAHYYDRYPPAPHYYDRGPLPPPHGPEKGEEVVDIKVVGMIVTGVGLPLCPCYIVTPRRGTEHKEASF